jgi:uncharacterized protein YbcI
MRRPAAVPKQARAGAGRETTEGMNGAMGRQKLVTPGQMEATISDIISRFEKEYMGRGPLETKTHIIGDLVLTRMKGILTKAELKLVHSAGKARARDLIKQVRIELLENARPLLEDLIKSVTRRRVRSLHTDISTSTGEKIIVFTLDRAPEFSSSDE